MVEGPGGHALKDNIEQQNRQANWPFNWLFRKRGGPSARKTVTFGDAAEVSGALAWTIASLVVILALWFISTTVWGLPDEWSQYGEEVRAGLTEDESYGQRDLLRDCDNSADEPESFPGLPPCSYTQWLSESTLPGPLQVWDAAWDFARNGYSGFTLWQHLWLSFSRLAKGLFWGVAIGVPIGLAMGLSSRWRGIFDPVVELLRPIPPLALIPLFIVWFGIGEEGKVNLLLFAAVWIMVISARSGVLAVNTTKVHAAYSLGASKAQVLRHVILAERTARDLHRPAGSDRRVLGNAGRRRASRRQFRARIHDLQGPPVLPARLDAVGGDPHQHPGRHHGRGDANGREAADSLARQRVTHTRAEPTAQPAASGRQAPNSSDQPPLTRSKPDQPSIVGRWRRLARARPARVVLADGLDNRAVAAARRLTDEGLADPVLLDDADAFCSDAVRAQAAASPWHERIDLNDPLHIAALMVAAGQADACVAGAARPTADVVRAALSCIGAAPGVNLLSSCFLLVLPDGTPVTYADCGVVPEPDAGQLAAIAVASAATHEVLAGEQARVAMLSYSTKGSAHGARVELVRSATEILRRDAPWLLVDGELQFDAAWDAVVAESKAPGSPVAGQANVFVFPDLSSGNIAYKITQRLAGAQAFGPLLQGTASVMHDLSRGCDVDDIVNVAVIAACQFARSARPVSSS